MPEGAGIARMSVTTSVTNLEPGPTMDSPLRLSSGQKRTIYYFTELRGLDGRTIIHQWEWNGRVIHRRELHPHSQAWRAYSGLPITGDTPGWWTVSAIDAKTGSVLAESHFEVE